jgi:hypothetical protein
MQLINKETGELSFADDFILSPKTTPEEIFQYFKDGVLNDMGPKSGWKNYTIRNIQLDNLYFIFTFHFEKDILRHLDFIVSENPIVAGSWDDWSEKEEEKKRNDYNNWLTKEIGKSREFPWGRVDAIFDRIGGGTSIILRYT